MAVGVTLTAALAGSLLVLTSQAATTVSSFSATADARVEKSAPTRNFGSATKLLSDGSPVTESFFRFTVAGVSGTVARAQLRVYAHDGSSNGPAVYATGTSWAEASINYANRPARTSAALEDKAGVPSGTWVTYDVTSAVKGDGTYGFVLAGPSKDATGMDSRETARPPVLDLTVTTTDAPAPAPTPDTTPPSASITAPAAGSSYTSAQTVPITVQASDDTGVERVEYYDQGVYRASEDTAPYSYAWQVTSADNGAHRWTAKVYDAAGNSSSSAPVDVSVDVAAPDGGTASGPVSAVSETDPVPHSGDAADDPAIWIHPTDPAKSTVIGTDKLGGLGVYDLQGTQLQYQGDSQPNNVDLRYNFPLAGERVGLVATSDRTTDSIRLYRVDAQTRELVHVSARQISTGHGLYGLCMYHSPQSGKYYVFESDNSGTVQQWELFEAGSGKVDAKKVRSFAVGSTTEGCVADDELGGLYISEEDVALWRYGAEPGAGSERSKVDAAGAGRLSADIEGLSIYYGAGGAGYLIASSQGSSNFAVYDRGGGNPFVKSFQVDAGAVDAATYTDGIDVTNVPLGERFSEGAFVAQDDRNDSGNQNFKLVPWGQVARSGTPLKMDTSFDPRQVGASDPAPTPAPAPEPTPAPTPAPDPTPAPSGGTSYHVDSTAGSDSEVGTSPETAWRTLRKAASAPLNPADRLLLRRGSSWSETLDLPRSGTSDHPIEVSAYGEGARPEVKGVSRCALVGGSYVAVRELKLGPCSWAGIEVYGSHDTIERNLVTGNAAGVYVKPGAVSNRILGNDIKDNNQMSVLTQTSTSDDSGAFGVLLKGDDTEVAQNLISGSDAFSYDYGRDGAAIEVYGGQRNHIHHNQAVDNDVFTELGNPRSADNTYAYNMVRSALADSVFAVTRGAESGYGPVTGTRLYNNSIRLTGANSQGFVCHAGCSPEILRMRNNIVSAVKKTGYADGVFDEDYDLFLGGPEQFQVGSHSRIGDPLWIEPSAWNLRLRLGSPAIDAGANLPYSRDLDDRALPRDGDGDGQSVPDLGSYEYGG